MLRPPERRFIDVRFLEQPPLRARLRSNDVLQHRVAIDERPGTENGPFLEPGTDLKGVHYRLASEVIVGNDVHLG